MTGLVQGHIKIVAGVLLLRRLRALAQGKTRIGGLTIEETAEKQDAASKSSDKRRKETREGRKGDRA
jgi:hypothetical protein